MVLGSGNVLSQLAIIFEQSDSKSFLETGVHIASLSKVNFFSTSAITRH